MGRHTKSGPPARPYRDLRDYRRPGQARDDLPPQREHTTSTTTTTGSHRAVLSAAPRGVAKWPIACLVAIGLIAVGWIGWGWGNNILNNRAEAQAHSCTGGTSTLRVSVAPSIEQPVTDAADKWNSADRVVHDRCVTVEVQSAESQSTLDSLGGNARVGGAPAAWIPESNWWADQLGKTHPDRIAGQHVSIATAKSADYPFIGIRGEGIDPVQERAAQTFQRFLQDPEQRKLFTKAGFDG